MKNDNTVPNHIAIILDGNGRFAKKNFLPRQMGHKKGAETLKKIVTYANEIKVKYLTVYAFSTENWNRDKTEVDYLMGLLLNYLDSFLNDSADTNIKITTIGDKSKLSKNIVSKIDEVTRITKDNTGLCFIVAINYGAKDEITRAIRNITIDVKNGMLNTEDITETTVSSYLDTKDFPDPDLLIRTSNEYRLSNFLLWQCSYSELYFSEKLWPEFTKEDLDNAISDYNNRERRFGGRIK